MIRRIRILFTFKAGSLGHFIPLLPLAQAAVGSGHEVVFASGPDCRQTVEQFGFRFIPSGLTLMEASQWARAQYPGTVDNKEADPTRGLQAKKRLSTADLFLSESIRCRYISKKSRRRIPPGGVSALGIVCAYP